MITPAVVYIREPMLFVALVKTVRDLRVGELIIVVMVIMTVMVVVMMIVLMGCVVRMTVV